MNAVIDSVSGALSPGVYAYDLEALPWRETPRGTARVR